MGVETASHRHSQLSRLIAENPTIINQDMAVHVFLESYPPVQQKSDWNLLRRQPGTLALGINGTLYVTHEERREKTWS